MPEYVEFITIEDLNLLETRLAAKIEELKFGLVTDMDRYLTIEQAMEFTKTKSYSTVRNWIKFGKKDRFGTVYKLESLEFAPGQHRILQSKLIEYGKIKGCVAIARKNQDSDSRSW